MEKEMIDIWQWAVIIIEGLAIIFLGWALFNMAGAVKQNQQSLMDIYLALEKYHGIRIEGHTKH